jgi:protein associated with RNAse G/E
MNPFSPYRIKSFKHDGHLHRMWMKNWRIPDPMLIQEHRDESMIVLINSQTPIRERDGKEWTSKIPSVTFFIPGQWFNVVSLLEDQGVRYYCNIASPPYVNDGVITYIDYDLDVIRTPDGYTQVVDQEEYELHKQNYHYSDVVERKVKRGLEAVLGRLKRGETPFRNEQVLAYYEMWKNDGPEG